MKSLLIGIMAFSLGIGATLFGQAPARLFIENKTHPMHQLNAHDALIVLDAYDNAISAQKEYYNQVMLFDMTTLKVKTDEKLPKSSRITVDEHRNVIVVPGKD
jgi:hypothetical protein